MSDGERAFDLRLRAGWLIERIRSADDAVVGDETRQMRAGLVIFRVIRQVRELHRIGMNIKEHGSFDRVLAKLSVPPLFRANSGAMNGDAVFAPDTEGWVLPGRARIVKQRHEAVALNAFRQIEIAELCEGAIDVERLHDAG